MTAEPGSTKLASQLLVGTYTEELPHVAGKAEGILACSYADGRVGTPRLAALLRNPSFITATPSGEHVYAASETFEFAGQPGGGLTAFERDRATGELRVLNEKPTGGDSPCYIVSDARGEFLLVANYAAVTAPGSVAVFRREKNGSIGEMVDFVEHSGAGPNPARQQGSHPHMVIFYPDDAPGQDPRGDVLVPDLGTDAVVTYGLSDEGKLREKSELRLATAAGAGPRHVRFHPSGRYLFVLNELDCTLMVARFESNRLTPLATRSTLPSGSFPNSTASELRLTRDGSLVFASNRGSDSDSIAMFGFDEDTEELALVHVESSRGEVPREFTISPDDRYVLVANQNSDTVVSFAIKADQPGLEFVGETAVPTPVSLLFV